MLIFQDTIKRTHLFELEKKDIKPVSVMLSRTCKDNYKEAFRDVEERKAKMPYVNELYLLCNYSEIRAFITSPQLRGIAV
jgi:hypothetical protein